MARHTLSNGIIKIQVEEKGAELQELILEQTGASFMWKADPGFWGKHSPVLFPIVGALKNNSYSYNDKVYSLGRHGFARDRMFELAEQKSDRLVFLLKADTASAAVYPFDFNLYIHYQLNGQELSVTYEVHNNGDAPMYYSIGAHPAFGVPFETGTVYEDYYLDFGQRISAPRWPISAEGLIELKPVPLLDNTAILPLSKSLFEKDALVFKDFPASGVTIRSEKSRSYLRMDWDDNFTYLGLWAAKGADFICIEPWCGIADSTDADGNLLRKEGIRELPPRKTHTSTWSVSPGVFS